jgi:hypothetical protein
MTGQVFDTGPLSKIKDVSKGRDFLVIRNVHVKPRSLLLSDDQLVDKVAPEAKSVILDQTLFTVSQAGKLAIQVFWNQIQIMSALPIQKRIMIYPAHENW